MKVAIIGDIHGCLEELEKLYALIPKDYDIYCTGDLADRGYDIAGCYDFIKEHDIKPIMGNHDFSFLKKLHPEDSLAKYIKSFPFYRIIDKKYLLSHAGVRQGLTLKEAENLCFCANEMSEYSSLEKKGLFYTFGDSIIWTRAELEPLTYCQIVGHNPLKEPYLTEKSIYIDTGCVFGNYLSAILLPERQIIKVKSKFNCLKG